LLELADGQALVSTTLWVVTGAAPQSTVLGVQFSDLTGRVSAGQLESTTVLPSERMQLTLCVCDPEFASTVHVRLRV